MFQKGVIQVTAHPFPGKNAMGNNIGRNIERAAVNTGEINSSYTLLPKYMYRLLLLAPSINSS